MFTLSFGRNVSKTGCISSDDGVKTKRAVPQLKNTQLCFKEKKLHGAPLSVFKFESGFPKKPQKSTHNIVGHSLMRGQ